MKCSVCKKNIETTFLKKLVGTRIMVGKKEKYVCSSCQSKLKTKDEILKAID